jgi:hypothetical protein
MKNSMRTILQNQSEIAIKQIEGKFGAMSGDSKVVFLDDDDVFWCGNGKPPKPGWPSSMMSSISGRI